jgi:hypothetical protein
MKIKVKVKLPDMEYREFISGLRVNYGLLETKSFSDIVILETLEQFLLRCFEHIWNSDTTRSFTLNAIQAYSIYYVITDINMNFTPFQSGINTKIATVIEHAIKANLTRRNAGGNNFLIT